MAKKLTKTGLPRRLLSEMFLPARLGRSNSGTRLRRVDVSGLGRRAAHAPSEADYRDIAQALFA